MWAIPLTVMKDYVAVGNKYSFLTVHLQTFQIPTPSIPDTVQIPTFRDCKKCKDFVQL